MRRLDDAYVVICLPRVWEKLENIPAVTLERIDQALEVLATQLGRDDAQAAAGRPRTGTVAVDDHIAIYEIDTEKRRLTLASIIRRPEILSP